MTDATEDSLKAELERLRARLDWICNEELRSANFGGLAAQGYFDPERERIVQRTEELLDEWSALIKARNTSS